MATDISQDDTLIAYGSVPERAQPLQGTCRTAAWAIWGAAAAIMYGFTLAGLVPRYRQLSEIASDHRGALADVFGVTPVMYAGYMVSIAVLMLLIYTTLALVIFLRRAHDPVALLTSLTLMAVATASSDFSDALLALYPRLYIPVDLIRALSLGLPPMVLFVFPTGLAVPHWARWALIAQLTWTLARPLLYTTPLHPRAWPGGVFALWVLLWLGGGFAAQTYRYNTSATEVQRRQTRWIVFGSGSSVALYLIVVVAWAFYPQMTVVGSRAWVLTRPVEFTLFVLAMTPLPLALTASITRYRLLDIDYIISRSLVYGVLTALALLILGASLFAASQLFETITGGERSIIAMSFTALLFGVLLSPVRRRMQEFVDRHLYGIRIRRRPGRWWGLSIHDPRSALRDDLAAYGDLHLVGSGGMATVYRGIDPLTGRAVAIKVLSDRASANPEALLRFEREVEIAARLAHPNIARMITHGSGPGVHYMVMEYVRGLTLADLLSRPGALPLAQAVPLLVDIANALDYAHSLKLVHRDVKPANILLEEATPAWNKTRIQRAVLTDFGIARMREDAPRSSKTSLIGTFDFMAPEQVRGQSDIDGRADIYALGVMAFLMLTGVRPFPATNPDAVLIAHLQHPPPDPRALLPDLPVRAAAAIQRAMAKEPGDRFASAGEFVQELAAALNTPHAAI